MSCTEPFEFDDALWECSLIIENELNEPSSNSNGQKWRYWWSKMGDFHLSEAQQFPNSNAAIGFKSNLIATLERWYIKKSVLNSKVTIVFAKNYLKRSKVNGNLMVCVWSPRRCWPPISKLRWPFFFFLWSKWASKIEEKCVPLDYQWILGCMRVFPCTVHENVTLLIKNLLFHEDRFSS